MRIGPEFKSRISEHEGKILALATRNVVTLPSYCNNYGSDQDYDRKEVQAHS